MIDPFLLWSLSLGLAPARVAELRRLAVVALGDDLAAHRWMSGPLDELRR